MSISRSFKGILAISMVFVLMVAACAVSFAEAGTDHVLTYIDQIEADLANLKGDAEALGGDISDDIKAEIDTAHSQLAEVKANLLADGEAFTDEARKKISDAVTNLRTALSNIEQSATGLEEEAGGKLYTWVKDAKAQLALYELWAVVGVIDLDANARTTLRKACDDAKAAIANLKTEAETLADDVKGDIHGAAEAALEKIAYLETMVSDEAAELTAEVKADIQNTISNIADSIGQMKAHAQAIEGDVASKVHGAMADVSAYLEGIANAVMGR